MTDNNRATQYLRKISVTITGASGKGIELLETGADAGPGPLGSAAPDHSPITLRTVFHVERGDFQEPNVCDIRIYNMTEATGRTILPHDHLVLQAGYEGNYGVIFQGDIKQVRVGRDDGKDSYVDIKAADGDEAYNFSTTVLSMAAGAKPENILKQYISNMAKFGLNLGYKPDLLPNGSIRGKIDFGMTRDGMREWAEQNGCKWHVQDEQVLIVPKQSYMPSEFPVVSIETGLIGVPEQIEEGLAVQVLLNPALKVGQCFKLDNRSVVSRLRVGTESIPTQNLGGELDQIKLSADGLYYVMNASHHGDTRGDPWYTDLICLSVDASLSASIDPAAVVNTDAAVIAGSP